MASVSSSSKMPREFYNFVIALAGPHGSGSTTLAAELVRVLKDWPGCHVERVPVSELIQRFHKSILGQPVQELASQPKRRESLQGAGTALRMKEPTLVGRVVAYAIQQAGHKLETELRDGGSAKETLFFIVDSLKNTKDVSALKSIYGDEFIFVFVTADRVTRWRRLCDYKGWTDNERAKFHELDTVDRDEESVNPSVMKAGQQVRKLAPLADYYVVNDGNRKELQGQGKRLVHLLMGDGRNQPTRDERSMHLAFSAANRSYCLSRQVGAAIFNKNGDVLSLGHNDVPRSGGGLYHQEDGEQDRRCYLVGNRSCINDEQKRKRFEHLTESLVQALGLGPEHQAEVQKLVEASDFKDATEYCRAVHAEMEALLATCRTPGQSTIDASMYVTTQPCHNCSKHIVASGISRVVFVEPYPKSLAEELHSDSVLIDPPPGQEQSGRAVFIPYRGVAPRRYHDFFSMTQDRKDRTGSRIQKTKSELAAEPKFGDRIRRRSREPNNGDKVSGAEWTNVTALEALAPGGQDNEQATND